MLGHRKLNVEDYLAILKRRRWLILIPVILLPMIAYGVSFLIPAQYLSQTLVLIEEQKVPDDLVKSVMSSSLESRLASMREQILSRSRIQPIIERWNLFPSKRFTMDDRVDLTRKAITIKPIRSDVANRGGLPGFFIAFTASDARTAQAVCGEITSLFVAENLRSREASNEGTTDFLKGQLEDAKKNLDEHDAKLAAFQRQYVGKLPGQEMPNLNMLTSLNTQLEAATQALAQMQQQKAYQESMLSQQVANAQTFSVPSASGAPGPAAPGLEQQQLQLLQAQEAELLAHYTPDYPDVITVRRKIAELKRKIAQEPAPTYTASSSSAGSAPNRNDSPAIQQLRASVRAADIGIIAKQREQANIQSAIGMYQDRIQSSPLVQEQFKELMRDYDTAQKFYTDLLTKMNNAKMAGDLERRQQGEQFRVMDEPNLPDAPTFPNRALFAAGGVLAGLAIGLLLAALLEYKDTALRTEQDVWVFTQLPTLAVIAYSGPVSNLRERVPLKTRLQRLIHLKSAKKDAPGTPDDNLTKATV